MLNGIDKLSRFSYINKYAPQNHFAGRAHN